RVDGGVVVRAGRAEVDGGRPVRDIGALGAAGGGVAGGVGDRVVGQRHVDGLTGARCGDQLDVDRVIRVVVGRAAGDAGDGRIRVVDLSREVGCGDRGAVERLTELGHDIGIVARGADRLGLR